MPRYLVERSFPEGLSIEAGADGVRTRQSMIERNAHELVTWIHSYVSSDKRKTFCVYDGPTPEAIRRTALANGWPVDAIVEVQALDPYFYH